MRKRVRQVLSTVGSTVLGGVAGAVMVILALQIPMVEQLIQTMELWHALLLLPI